MSKKVYVCCQHAYQYDEYTRLKLQRGSRRHYQCVTDPERLTGLTHIDAVLIIPMHDHVLAITFAEKLRVAFANWTEEDLRDQA